MSARERFSTVPGPNDPPVDTTSETAERPCKKRSTTVRRFEIGLFLRKRIKRRPVFNRQASLSTGRNLARVPAPQSQPGEELSSPAMNALSARSSQGTGDTLESPDVAPLIAVPEDDAGPIHGVSYEAGGFVSVTTETTTDSDDDT